MVPRKEEKNKKGEEKRMNKTAYKISIAVGFVLFIVPPVIISVKPVSDIGLILLILSMFSSISVICYGIKGVCNIRDSNKILYITMDDTVNVNTGYERFGFLDAIGYDFDGYSNEWDEDDEYDEFWT